MIGCSENLNCGASVWQGKNKVPEFFALFAHSDASSCDLPSVNTMLTFGMLGLAPSLAEKLNANMWRKAEPVMEPLPMYCIRDTACLIPCAVVYWLRVNSVRTLVEYCSRPTCVPVRETFSESTMEFTNCLTSSKLAGPRLLEPSITKTGSMTPSPHSGSETKVSNIDFMYSALKERIHSDYFKKMLNLILHLLQVWVGKALFRLPAQIWFMPCITWNQVGVNSKKLSITSLITQYWTWSCGSMMSQSYSAIWPEEWCATSPLSPHLLLSAFCFKAPVKTSHNTVLQCTDTSFFKNLDFFLASSPFFGILQKEFSHKHKHICKRSRLLSLSPLLDW